MRVREHPDTELLSSYLDSELSASEAGRLQEHLRACASCAERLGALRHTVSRLRTLARPVPPAAIVEELRARLPGARRPPAWRQRFERVLREGLVLQPAVATGFALIVGLAVAVYFHSHRVQPRRPTTLVVAPVEVEESPPPQPVPEVPAPAPPAAAAPLPASPRAQTAPGADAAAKSAAQVSPPPDAAGEVGRARQSPAALLSARRLGPPLEQRAAGRTFELREGVWVEIGLDPAATVRRVAAASTLGLELVERFPELAPMLRTGAVRLAVDGRVLEIERPPAELP